MFINLVKYCTQCLLIGRTNFLLTICSLTMGVLSGLGMDSGQPHSLCCSLCGLGCEFNANIFSLGFAIRWITLGDCPTDF